MPIIIGTPDGGGMTKRTGNPIGKPIGAHSVEPATKLAALMREKRMARGDWSQERAAEFFGISQGSYNGWESGVSAPDPKHWAKVASFADITITDLWWIIYGE